MFCVVHIEVSQLVKETARRTEKEEGRLDVEHRVEVLQQEPLLVLDCANRKLVDGLNSGDSRACLNGIKTCPLHKQS